MKSGYLPSLDGWRTVAILSVIFFHDSIHRVGRFSNSFLHTHGDLGVDLFFAISGILICSRLLEEERITGKISLRGFYIRRIFRICPAAWTFLFTYLLLAAFHLVPMDFGGVITAFLMVRNFWVHFAGDAPNTWYTIHFWSLSVEEHFYLLLPALLVFGKSRRVQLLGLLSCLCLIWVEVVMHFPTLRVANVWIRTDVRLHALLIPALFAVLLGRQHIRKFVIRWFRPWLVITLFVLTEIIWSRVTNHVIQNAGLLIIPIGFPLIVVSTMLHPRAWVTRLLETWPMRSIGRISYSLYLWQQIFFVSGHTPARWPLSTLQVFPFNYLAAFACAIASYYVIEKPLIRVGHRLAHPVSPGHEDLNVPAGLSDQSLKPSSPTEPDGRAMPVGHS
jgi:peptidoglycan/LPS O-acetylase OafA/YrhL